MKIKSIYVYKSEPKVRLKVEHKTGRLSTVYIEPCYDSWEQYGAENEVLYFTMPLAEKLAGMNYFRNFDKLKRKGLLDTDGVKESLSNRI